MASETQTRRRQSPDRAQYSPFMVEDLLNGLNEWKNVHDIIRLTFKALSDVTKTQGAAILELERQMPTKASKAELVSGLNTKANISEVTQALIEASAAWQRQPDPESFQHLLEEKVSKTEFHAVLRNFPSERDVKSLLDLKVNSRQFDTELNLLHEELEELHRNDATQVQRLEQNLAELCKVLDQKADLQELEKTNQNKANRQSVINALHSKANREDLETALSRKANLQNVEECIAEINILRSALEQQTTRGNELMQEMRKESFAHIDSLERDIESFRADFRKYQSSSSAGIKELEALSTQLDQKADADKVSTVLSSFQLDINSQIRALETDLRKGEERLFVQFKDFVRVHEKSVSGLETHNTMTKDHLLAISQDSLRKCEDLDRRLVALQESLQDVKDLQSDLTSFVQEMKREKADVYEIDDLKKQLRESSNARIPVSELATLKTEQRKELAQCKEALIDHVTKTQSELAHFVESIAKDQHSPGTSPIDPELASLKKEMSQCARTKEICKLIDSKANIDDVNQTLIEIHKDIENKVPFQDYRLAIKELKTATELLLSETCVARWLWTSGTIKPDRRVPWEVQTVNTRPDNFIWEQGQITVYTVAPGLYEISLGIFTRTKPKAQFFVNDQVMYRLGYSETEGEKLWVPHLDGNLIGLTLQDVMALPTRARIYLTFEGDWSAEAFLSLKKL